MGVSKGTFHQRVMYFGAMKDYPAICETELVKNKGMTPSVRMKIKGELYPPVSTSVLMNTNQSIVNQKQYRFWQEICGLQRKAVRIQQRLRRTWQQTNHCKKMLNLLSQTQTQQKRKKKSSNHRHTMFHSSVRWRVTLSPRFQPSNPWQTSPSFFKRKQKRSEVNCPKCLELQERLRTGGTHHFHYSS